MPVWYCDRQLHVSLLPRMTAQNLFQQKDLHVQQAQQHACSGHFSPSQRSRADKMVTGRLHNVGVLLDGQPVCQHLPWTTTRCCCVAPKAVRDMATDTLMASAFAKVVFSGCNTMMVDALLAATCSDTKGDCQVPSSV